MSPLKSTFQNRSGSNPTVVDESLKPASNSLPSPARFPPHAKRPAASTGYGRITLLPPHAKHRRRRLAPEGFTEAAVVGSSIAGTKVLHAHDDALARTKRAPPPPRAPSGAVRVVASASSSSSIEPARGQGPRRCAHATFPPLWPARAPSPSRSSPKSTWHRRLHTMPAATR